MTLAPGHIVSVAIEKPAVGGRMIGRIDGQIVLVSGAIPGERVRARIERSTKGVTYADTVDVEQASPDRRPPFTDLACGGSLYAHIHYPRQLDIKSAVIADAFARIGRLSLPTRPTVRASIDEGYRMRARLHVRGGRIGFFREATHDLCDVRATRQLLPATMDVLDRVGAAMRSVRLDAIRELDLSENLDASERAIGLAADGPIPAGVLDPIAATDGLTGMLLSWPTTLPPRVVAGRVHVTDTLTLEKATVRLRRHVLSFFQGNRYLLQPLVARVLDAIAPSSSVIDLYAGAGLFAICAAVARGASVIAVEGDRLGAADLSENVRTAAAAVEPVHQPVEVFTASSRHATTIVVDPPRTGMSREALAGVLRIDASRLVYVSCDVATLARDARKIVDAGYLLKEVDAFDLFPNTPHVETVVVFDRS